MQQDQPVPNQAIQWRRVIINELCSLYSWLYYMLLKPVILLGIIMAIIYFAYVYLICQKLCFLPLICYACPQKTFFSGERALASIPPINTVAQQTAVVIKALTDTDVSAPHRLVAIQTILAEIDSRVQFSDIDETTKEQLKSHLGHLDKLIERGIEEIIEMHKTMRGALDSIQIHTEHTFKDFMRVMNGEKSLFGFERIGEPKTETEKMQALFGDYVSSMHTELGQIVETITITETTLKEIREKLKTIQNLYASAKNVSIETIRNLKDGSIWIKIFGGNSIDIERQQSVIDTIEEFSNFNKLFLSSVGGIIVMVKDYKIQTKKLKDTKIPHNAGNFKLKIYLEQIQKAITQLSKSKEDFDEKIERRKRQEKIDL